MLVSSGCWPLPLDAASHSGVLPRQRPYPCSAAPLVAAASAGISIRQGCSCVESQKTSLRQIAVHTPVPPRLPRLPLGTEPQSHRLEVDSGVRRTYEVRRCANNPILRPPMSPTQWDPISLTIYEFTTGTKNPGHGMLSPSHPSTRRLGTIMLGLPFGLIAITATLATMSTAARGPLAYTSLVQVKPPCDLPLQPLSGLCSGRMKMTLICNPSRCHKVMWNGFPVPLPLPPLQSGSPAASP